MLYRMVARIGGFNVERSNSVSFLSPGNQVTALNAYRCTAEVHVVGLPAAARCRRELLIELGRK